jgi:PIN domain nuclease of toxin-antitoxin system
LTPRLLLDTHVVVRWLATPKKLSRDQSRILRESARRGEPVAISAITLLEIATLFVEGRVVSKIRASDLLRDLESDHVFQIMPLTIDIAREVAALGRSLHDPADRAIVATARVRGLRLVTSDQRIIESNLVPVVV